MEGLANAKNYRVFPNPSNDYIYIRSVDLDAKTIQIENITGRTIYTSKDEEKDPIDIRQWNPGIYFIRINALNTKTSVTLKFIKN